MKPVEVPEIPKLTKYVLANKIEEKDPVQYNAVEKYRMKKSHNNLIKQMCIPLALHAHCLLIR